MRLKVSFTKCDLKLDDCKLKQKFTKMIRIIVRRFVQACKMFPPLSRRVSWTITPRIKYYARIIIVKRFDLLLCNFTRSRDLLTDRTQQSLTNFWKHCKEVSRRNRLVIRNQIVYLCIFYDKIGTICYNS